MDALLSQINSFLVIENFVYLIVQPNRVSWPLMARCLSATWSEIILGNCRKGFLPTLNIPQKLKGKSKKNLKESDLVRLVEGHDKRGYYKNDRIRKTIEQFNQQLSERRKQSTRCLSWSLLQYCQLKSIFWQKNKTDGVEAKLLSLLLRCENTWA